MSSEDDMPLPETWNPIPEASGRIDGFPGYSMMIDGK